MKDSLLPIFCWEALQSTFHSEQVIGSSSCIRIFCRMSKMSQDSLPHSIVTLKESFSGSCCIFFKEQELTFTKKLLEWAAFTLANGSSHSIALQAQNELYMKWWQHISKVIMYLLLLLNSQIICPPLFLFSPLFWGEKMVEEMCDFFFFFCYSIDLMLNAFAFRALMVMPVYFQKVSDAS